MEESGESKKGSGELSREQIKSSIRYSIGEGVASAASDGATKEYYIPYALAAGASASVVGWLVALAQLVIAFCYLKVPDYVRKIGSRRRSVLILVFIDAVTFLPFVFIPFVIRDYVLQTIFLFYILSIIPTVVIGPIWASWITELVPAGIRGRYLGQRLTFMGISELMCFVGAGLLLNWFASQVFLGFSIIFSFAAVARLAAWFMYWKMDDVPITRREEVTQFGILDVLPILKNGSIGKFMVFTSSLYFTIFLAQPFFAVFLLSDLGFSYLAFMLIVCSEQAARLLILRYWGKYADTKGNLRVVKLVSMFIPFVPLLWLVSQNIVYLICVQIATGVAMAGFDLCAANFMYGAAPTGARIKHIALFRALNGVGAALGALLGGLLALGLFPIFGHKLLTLFLISGLLRAGVVLKLLPSIVDVSRKHEGNLAWDGCQSNSISVDAVSEGFGWGLLYVPESVRRDISRAFERTPKARSGANLWHAGEKLFQKWVRLAFRRRTVDKFRESSPFDEQRESLRRIALDRLMADQVSRKAAEKAEKAADRSHGFKSRELWHILAQRFLVGKFKKEGEADGVRPVRTGLLYDTGLAGKVIRQRLGNLRAISETPGRNPSDPVRRRWLLEAIRHQYSSVPVESRRQSSSAPAPVAVPAAIYRRMVGSSEGGKDGSSHRTGGLGQLSPTVRMTGLLYREDAWKYLAGGGSTDVARDGGGRGKAVVNLVPLFYDTQAWARFRTREGCGTAGDSRSGAFKDGNPYGTGSHSSEWRLGGLIRAWSASLAEQSARRRAVVVKPGSEYVPPELGQAFRKSNTLPSMTRLV